MGNYFAKNNGTSDMVDDDQKVTDNQQNNTLKLRLILANYVDENVDNDYDDNSIIYLEDLYNRYILWLNKKYESEPLLSYEDFREKIKCHIKISTYTEYADGYCLKDWKK